MTLSAYDISLRCPDGGGRLIWAERSRHTHTSLLRPTTRSCAWLILLESRFWVVGLAKQWGVRVTWTGERSLEA